MMMSKKIRLVFGIAAVTVLSGCLSVEERELIQSYATTAGMTYGEAQSSTRIVQSALRNLGLYSGRVNGVPSVETNAALQAYVDEERRTNRSRTTGAPRPEEISKLISDYERFLETLRGSGEDSASVDSSSGFSAEREPSGGSASSSSESFTTSSASFRGGEFQGGTVYSRDGSSTSFDNESDFQSARDEARSGGW